MTFASFVILGDMRTGSNALQERLNEYQELSCLGELFNPHFIGKPGQTDAYGHSLAERDADPRGFLLATARGTAGLSGFRLFSDHDRRALDLVLEDPACAKIVLTRNPLESYVSLKIARKTGQWWMGDLSRAKPGKAQFELNEFEQYLADRAAWHHTIRRHLQTTGQTAFEIGYADLGDDAVIEGLARYLGASSEPKVGKRGRVQHPTPLSERVTNFGAMRAALQDRDPYDLDHLPDHEPTRGPNVPSFVAAKGAPLLFMPIKCADDMRVRAWMAGLGPLETGFDRKSVRHWKRKQGRHASFTVLVHPVQRTYEAFCRFILPTGEGAFTGIRRTLIQSYKLPLPEDPGDPSYDIAAHHAAFLAFLAFLKGNLAGQTAVRVDGAWASLEVSTRALAGFGVPDIVLRSETLPRDLSALAARFDLPSPPVPDSEEMGPFPLGEIYDQKIEKAARAAYQRDYMMFGFGAWR